MPAAVLDEQHVGIDARGREQCTELVGVPPVGGAGTTVEQTRVAEQEGSRADRQHPGTSGMGTPEDLEDGLRGRGIGVTAVRRGDDQVGLVRGVQPVGEDHRHPVVELDGLLRVLGARAEVDRGHAVVGAVDPEDLLDDPDLEEPGTGWDDHGHGPQRHVRQYGRKLANYVNPATRGEIVTVTKLLP
jgi:hypothetical protein